MRGEGLKRLSIPFRLIPFQTSTSTAPTAAQISKATQFFNKCECRLSDVVSDPKKIFENDSQKGNSNEIRKQRPSLPEVMILGRSNVGKSSLISALMTPLKGNDSNTIKKKEFARSSSRAGFTQTLNFYNCSGRLRIIDTPGYGHGSAQTHGNLVFNYIQAQRDLKRIYVLVDGYTGISPLDDDIFKLLASTGVPWNVVLTKLDKHIKKVGESKTKTGGIKQFLTEQNTDLINGKIENALKHVQLMGNTADSLGGNGTVAEEVIGTCSHKRLNYMGIPELRASILVACGII